MLKYNQRYILLVCFNKNQKKKNLFFTVNESRNFVHLVVHFMKWSVDFLFILRNGQIFCPFHKMDGWVVHFMKYFGKKNLNVLSILKSNLHLLFVKYSLVFC